MLDVVGALVDAAPARIAIQPLDRKVAQVSVAAEHLDRLGADPLGGFGGHQLRHAGFHQTGPALVAQLCADIDGFGLHAGVRVQAHERKRLEQLCRYITRPALSEERIQLDAAGQVQLKLKTPWRDGTTHVVMSPLEFMQRLAALVPRPRLHLIRFHGVLAPNARLRALVVPQGPPEQDEPAGQAAGGAECEPEAVQARSHRIGWARLLERVFDIDMQHCPNCGAGQLKIIAAILQRPVIEKILTHLGLDPQPPPRGRAREAGHD